MPPTLSAFISTVALFMFAYGGLTAATSLGGETFNPEKNMPRGIVAGWAIALVVYTLIAFALFNAVPYQLAINLANTHHAYLLTAPALVGLMQSKGVAVFLNVLVTLIVIKTLAPVLLDASRYLYAWSEDGLVTDKIRAVNSRHVPVVALVITAGIGSLFLLDAVYAGWAIAVVIRATSVAATFATLGLGTLMLSWWPQWRESRPWATRVTEGGLIKWLSVLAIIIGFLLIASVINSPGKPWYYQPWFQVSVSWLIALSLLGYAMVSRRVQAGGSLTERFRAPPED
nr:APC family permease [Acidihalobacter ferrooxydans]